jgi:hypothetical protein
MNKAECRARACAHTHTHTHTYIHTYIHTYTYIQNDGNLGSQVSNFIHLSIHVYTHNHTNRWRAGLTMVMITPIDIHECRSLRGVIDIYSYIYICIYIYMTFIHIDS